MKNSGGRLDFVPGLIDKPTAGNASRLSSALEAAPSPGEGAGLFQSFMGKLDELRAEKAKEAAASPVNGFVAAQVAAQRKK